MYVLVLQPIRPSNPPALRARAGELLARMCDANPAIAFDVRQDDAQLDIPAHPSIYMRHATVRNYMLDTYLKDQHDAVLWIDSDLIDYPAELPTLLMEANPGGITAPMAVLSDSPGRMTRIPGRERFYDIGGFIERGNRARVYPPWFQQSGPVIELDSVGCCYLAPAGLYRPNYYFNPALPALRYAPPPTDYYVEHWSVMQQAKRRGIRICALTTVRAVHAWLPDYGLEAN